MKRIVLLISFLLFLTVGPARAEESVPSKNMAFTVKIAVVQGEQEIQGDEYTFFLANGEAGVYETSSSLPYWPKKEGNEVNFLSEGLTIEIKPVVQGKAVLVSSHIQGSLNTQNSVRNDTTVPNMAKFSYLGSSLITGDQFVEVFDGKLGADRTKRLKIFIKSGEK